MPVALLTHVPPLIDGVSVVVAPAHTVVVPDSVTDAPEVFTVTAYVAVLLPQLLVTV